MAATNESGLEYRFGRRWREQALTPLLMLCSLVAVLCTIGIVLSLVVESVRFFQLVSLPDFLFGLSWSPQTPLRADQVGASGQFGALPIFSGTLLITGIAMSVAVPIGLLAAIYLSEYAADRTRGLVMGVMIIPFVSSLSDDVIHAVPRALRDGAYALGATPSETIRQVVLPAALPGIGSAVLLAVSRAIGETMIVVMAAGLAPRLTANPLEAVTTVTVQMVTLLVGDQEFDSAKTLAAFALGLVLFVMTLMLNGAALGLVRRYRNQYE
jgi:phosphate transport system permease protein